MTGQGPGSDRTGLADHPRTTLSPRDAARLAQVGRSSIMRAIAGGDLPARRNNRNQWQIELEALECWRAGRPDYDRTMTEDNDRSPDRSPDRAAPNHLSAVAQELAEARAKAAEMQVRAEQLEARLDERAALVRMAEDRALASDAARAAAEARAQRAEALAAKLTDILAARPEPSPTSPRRRWWLWGRG